MGVYIALHCHIHCAALGAGRLMADCRSRAGVGMGDKGRGGNPEGTPLVIGRMMGGGGRGAGGDRPPHVSVLAASPLFGLVLAECPTHESMSVELAGGSNQWLQGGHVARGLDGLLIAMKQVAQCTVRIINW